VGSVAGVLVFAHRPDVVASAGIEFARDGVHRDARMLWPVAELPGSTEDIFGASGGAVCYSRAALADAGLFAEHFFNYLEDADLAWRLRLRGWRCLLAPDARVAHIYSATSGHFSSAKRRLLARNRWRVLVRCVPRSLLRSCLPGIAWYDLLAMAYGAVTGQFEIIVGRAQVVGELPKLLAERREIARRASTPPEELARWLVPAPTPRQVRQQARRLDRLLRERPSADNEH
jgi:GT2 family glycosyltransferase